MNQTLTQSLANFSAMLLLLSEVAGSSSPFSLKDDFSRYPDGAEPRPAWEAQDSGWSVLNGALQGEEGACVWTAVQWGTNVIYECDVTVLEQLEGDWLTAGIGFQLDEANYWALNFVVSPGDRKHSTEMQEMLGGTWLAQHREGSRLESTASRGSGFHWKTGVAYRLHMTLTRTNVLGRILDQGRIASEFAFSLSAPAKAVRAGVPMVRVRGLRARFDNATVTVLERATPPKPAEKPVVPWVSRPGKALAKGTGFFRTFQDGERWWLLDPEGKPFFDVGVDHVSYRGHWCEALGYAPYNRNVESKYGSETEWSKTTLQRLGEWGFNCLPAGHSPSLRHRGLAHIGFASFGTSFAKREWICRPVHWTGFPDVFSPRWERHCRILARREARELKGDPWCVGTFLDNELEWYGKNGHLVDEIFQLAADRPAKKALCDWLLNRFGSIGEINARLGARYADTPDFLSQTNVPSGPGLELVQNEFLGVIAERYFKVASGAMREADPDHMILGCRFAGRAPEPALAAAGKYNDVFTINTYPRVEFESAWAPDGTGGIVRDVPQQLAAYYEAVKRPMIITEWSFPALDSGLPCKHGAGMRVDTQEQKAQCYRIFATTMASLPYMVGYHYFMWADEPALGISSAFPEDSNYGLVNEKDEVYPALTTTAAQVNKQAAQRHAESQFSGLLKMRSSAEGVVVLNTNKTSSHGILRTTVRGESRIQKLETGPGRERSFHMPAKATWVAELQNWDGSIVTVVGGAAEPGKFTIVNTAPRKLTNMPLILQNGGLPQPANRSFEPGETLVIPENASLPEKCEKLHLRSKDTAWQCSRASGALFDRIESSGLLLGKLVFAVHARVNGRDHWIESTRVNSLMSREQPDGWVIEAEVEYPGAPSGPVGWRATVQAVLFKQHDLVLVRPLNVESTGTRPWRLMEAYFFCRSAIGGTAEDDIVGGPGVPAYYRAAEFITDSKAGGCFGALGSTDWQVTFWTNPGDQIHPDSRLTIEQRMEQGTKWESPNSPFLWIYASKKADYWKEIARIREDSSRIAINLPK